MCKVMQHQIFLAGGPLGSSHLAKGWSPTIRSIQDIRDISIWLDQLTNNPPIFSQPPSPWISQDSSACWTAWSWESPEARRWILDEQVQRIFLHKPSGNGDWTIKKLWFYPLIWKIWTFFRMLSLFHCIWSSVQHCTNLQQFFFKPRYPTRLSESHGSVVVVACCPRFCQQIIRSSWELSSCAPKWVISQGKNNGNMVKCWYPYSRNLEMSGSIYGSCRNS